MKEYWSMEVYLPITQRYVHMQAYSQDCKKNSVYIRNKRNYIFQNFDIFVVHFLRYVTIYQILSHYLDLFRKHNLILKAPTTSAENVNFNEWKRPFMCCRILHGIKMFNKHVYLPSNVKGGSGVGRGGGVDKKRTNKKTIPDTCL